MGRGLTRADGVVHGLAARALAGSPWSDGMQDTKARLGNRFSCFQCGTKFYDLNREPATCPECGADQAQAPVKDLKALLGSGKGKKRARAYDDEDEVEVAGDDEDAEGEEEELGLLDEDDAEGGEEEGDDYGDDDEEEGGGGGGDDDEEESGGGGGDEEED